MNSALSSFAIFGANYLHLLIIIIAVIQYFLISKTKRQQLTMLAIIALPIMFIVLKLIALLYYDPRPFVVGHFTPLIPHNPDNGFPSDHAILTGAISALIFTVNKKTGIVLWILTFLVAFSRVYVGVHHTIDVVASMAIAITVTYLCSIILPKLPKRLTKLVSKIP